MLALKPEHDIVHELIYAHAIAIRVFWIFVLFDEFPSVYIYVSLSLIDLICLLFPHFLYDLPYTFLDLFL